MTLELAGFALLVAFAAAVQGFLGFGYGVIVMAVLTLSGDLVHATAFVNISTLALSIAMVWREPQHVLWPLLARILPAMFLGMLIGLVALREVPRDVMVPVLGSFIVAIAAWNVAQPSLRKRESLVLDLVFGGVAGVTSGAFNTGGPPLVIHLYRRPEPPLTLVVTLQAIFIGSGIMRGVLAGVQGLLPRSSVELGLWTMPAVLAGTFAGMALARRIDPARFRRLAWVALGLLGLALVASG